MRVSALFNKRYLTAGLVLVSVLFFANSQATVPETSYSGLHWRLLPGGAFVLPGTYTVKLTAGGQTISRTLDVVLDPRVEVSHDELVLLLEFQQEVKTILVRAVSLHEEIESANEEARTSSVTDAPRRVAEVLTELAIDLEHADSPPTSSQRELLDYEKLRFDRAENEWKGLR